MLWRGVWVHPYTDTPYTDTKVGVVFWKIGDSQALMML